MKSILNKRVNIKSKESIHDGGWGVVVMESPEDDEYHVAMYTEDPSNLTGSIECVFSLQELKLCKNGISK